MTTPDISPRNAFVWVWLPGQTAPVVAGVVQVTDGELVFGYDQSYLERADAVSAKDG